MKHMFLVGRGIQHSLSPAMWNHLAFVTDRPFRYGLRDVGDDELDAILAEIRSDAVLAANVTMPYKAWAAAATDRRSLAVAATGAANLLLSDGTQLRAFNTDVIGARAILETRAPYEHVVVLGAGGTATAILEALTGLASNVAMANRTLAHAEDLAERYAGRFATITARPWAERDEHTPVADLIVSAVPAVDTAPIDVSRLGSETLVYDAVYRREPTVFQQELARRGITLSDGLTHLAAQAIAMLEPLGFSPSEAGHLLEGLQRATGRTVTAWGAGLG